MTGGKAIGDETDRSLDPDDWDAIGALPQAVEKDLFDGKWPYCVVTFTANRSP